MVTSSKAVRLYLAAQAALHRFRDDERGVTAIEYGLIAALVAAALAVAVGAVTGALTDTFSFIAGSMTAATTN